MIYKYNLGRPYDSHQSKFTVTAPFVKVKKILDIQLQGDYAMLWAEVEPSTTDDYLEIFPVWTGYSEPVDMEYIATIQEPKTGLVYHYYVKKPMENFDI